MSQSKPQKRYQYAAIVELTEDDPNGSVEKGDVLIQAGRCEDGVSHTAYSEQKGDFVDVECDVLALLRSESRMAETDLQTWARQIANDMDIMGRMSR